MALRQGMLYPRRFIPTRLLIHLPSQTGCIPGNALWIIGGKKGIGRMIDEVFAQREGVCVVLSSHTGYHHEAAQQGALGVVHCNVTQVEAARARLATLPERYRQLDGVIFAVDATTTLTLHQLSGFALHGTLTMKERGTANVLHVLARRDLLDERLLLLFYNSLAAADAKTGQTGYVTANAYLDALAQQLHTRYEANALSIGLDTLRKQGMLLDAISSSEYDVLRGLRPSTMGTLLQTYK